jgi:methylated-DNA-[protein]-cysteine S-methyltransferase
VAQLAIASALGPLTLVDSDEALVAVRWGYAADPRTTPLLAVSVLKILAYLKGPLTRFALRLLPRGSMFALAVQAQLMEIPYAQTRTCGQLAGALGSSPRAVGKA